MATKGGNVDLDIRERGVTGPSQSNLENCRQIAAVWLRLVNRRTLSGEAG